MNVAVYVVMGIDLEGKKDVLGHWVGDGAEGSRFWLAHTNIAQEWDRPIHNWEPILNQLAIRFEGRLPL